jgi:hypothetical protein
VIQLVLVLLTFCCVAAAQTSQTRNVIFVMTDGLRWQEVFRGVEPELMTRENGIGDPEALRKLYWRDDVNERRAALMPFLWNTLARGGQIYGNRDAGSEAYVTNGFNFSYPGYNETLTGAPDPSINSNDNIPNKNITVLEWLNRKPAFRGKVAAFGAWDVISAITNGARGGFPANSGYDAFHMSPANETVDLLNKLKVETGIWAGEPLDAYPFYTALEYMKVKKPRLLYISLGETDEWAHDGKYELYVKAVHRVDQYLRTIWETVQATPGYKDRTTLVISVDHGRGDGPENWKHHGEKHPDSKYMWMGFLGPDTPALGERKSIPAVTQSQIAATIADLLGEDYDAAAPTVGRPITDVRKH